MSCEWKPAGVVVGGSFWERVLQSHGKRHFTEKEVSGSSIEKKRGLFFILSQEMTGAILSVAPWRDAEKWEMERSYLTHIDITELLNQPTKAHITSSLPVVKVSSFLKPAWIQVLNFFFLQVKASLTGIPPKSYGLNYLNWPFLNTCL